ncbi:hypothetical protein [Paenibacillus sp.]|jgi:hypothetical protein|uniref:hypothetical protein n=1 Tax=Paenibacillus sp. TaxID=58172 RepID=UPI002831EAEA|nr:hypothetical protein [Paenibacillus sp.]MDR0266994.1 hypothetical protein [Paenibacillus sp.]
MGRFLDMRVSENSSTFGSPGTAVTTTPALFGVIGLQTQNVAGTGTNGLIVDLIGTIGLSNTGASTVTINIQRGATTVFGSGVIIYTAEAHFEGNETRLITVNSVDLTAPAAAQTEYTIFIRGTGTVTRTGPESFSGIAQNGLAPTP